MTNRTFNRQTMSCYYCVQRQIRIMGRNLCNTLLYLSIFYMMAYSGLVMYDSYYDGQQSLSVVRRSADGVTKLLFLSYCRAGSSISSEIFDIDDRAIFWYEPLDAFYFAKTGYYGRKDQKALMLQNETDFRPTESWEYAGITDFFSRLYTCRLSGLPPEFLAHRFLKHSSALLDYYQCYQQLSPDTITDDLDKCRQHLELVCGKSVHAALENKCLDLMEVVHNAKVLTSAQRGHYIEEYLVTSGMDKSRIKQVLRHLLAYRHCLDKLEDVSEQCLYKAEQACLRRPLRAIKVVRTSMKVISSVMATIPDLNIIIFVRDPRAIAYSRAGKQKEDYDIMNNLRLTCMKLRLDFTALRDINRSYPGSLAVVKFENFVESPHFWTAKMYEHFGYGTPRDLNEFIRTHMFSGEDDGKKWGNIRPNATEVANRWRHLVSPELMSKMSDYCADVITMLGYPL